MTLIEAVEQIVKKRDVTLRITIDDEGVTIDEWPSCMVRATGDTLAEALRFYLPPRLARLLSENGPKSSDAAGVSVLGPKLNPHHPDPANPDTHVPSSSPATVREQMEREWRVEQFGFQAVIYYPDGKASDLMPHSEARDIVCRHNASLPSGIVEQPKKETDLGKP